MHAARRQDPKGKQLHGHARLWTATFKLLSNVKSASALCAQMTIATKVNT